MIKLVTSSSIALLVAISMSACSMAPSVNPTSVVENTPIPTSPQPEAHPSSSPLPSKAPSPTTSLPTLVVNTVVTVPTQAALQPTQVCNRVAMGNPGDITIPDGSEVKPGQAFTKIWRLVNKGSCPWTPRYAVIWFSGEQFNAPITTYLSKRVQPDQEMDVSLDMVAPQQPGTYQSNWKLESPEGELIGIGPNGNSPFWVRIVVIQSESQQSIASPAPSATVISFIAGIVTLNNSDGVDLDSNLVNQGGKDDLKFVHQDEGDTLVPSNGASFATAGNIQPQLEQCQKISLTTTPINLKDMPGGNYWCFRTNQGLPGWARVSTLDSTADIINLEIYTWMIP